MRLQDFLTESFSFVSRDNHGNPASAASLMADTYLAKVIVKWGTDHRYGGEQIGVFEYEHDIPNGFSIILDNQEARIYETYSGEAGPVIKAILAQWPDYAEFTTDDGSTLAEKAKEKRARPDEQEFWYHGTTSEHVPTILKLGLRPQDVENRQYRGVGGSKEGMVYLTSDEDTARFHAANSVKHFGGAPTVLKIDIKGLESQIRTDHDVNYTTLDPRGFDSSASLDLRRIKKTAGQGSYLTIQTIAFSGRIPPTRISIYWQGKAVKAAPKVEKKIDHLAFINALGRAGQKLSQGEKYEFFKIIGLQPSGWTGRQVRFDDMYYEDVSKTLNSVYHSKMQPAKYAQWLRGMLSRSRYWRPSKKTSYVPDTRKEIGGLIAAEAARLIGNIANPNRSW
jgi:hypothetical protein